MEIYQVGGAVRDALLGEEPGDADWVVVGATAQELIDAGYRQVGKDFPVFLHPQSGEEYALARVEVKTGPGYRGFAVDAAPTVTLEQDLQRRDLTINAIAQTADGRIIDPYGGRQDLEQRVLRHVSDAFEEDPVRILRVARFAARFAHLGFNVADQTVTLMRKMVDAGETDALVPERVWAETQKALITQQPQVFIQVLRSCGALAVIYPELDALYGVPQPERWHPEIDTGVHIELVMAMVAALSTDSRVRFAALTHDLGKGTTAKENWPSHPGHEQRSAELVEQLSARLRIPNEHRDIARLVALYHGRCHRAHELRPGTVVDLFEKCDAFRRPDRFDLILLACEADARGRKGLEQIEYDQAEYLRRALKAAAAVGVDALDTAGLAGPAIGARLHQERVAAVSALTRD